MQRVMNLLMLCSLFIFTSLFGEIERRAVFLFELDKIELRIADVDAKQNKIVPLFFGIEKIPFSEDILTRNNQFSQKIETQAVDLLKKLVKKAEELQAKVSRGFAGKYFRDAKNMSDFIRKIHEETGLDILILSEEQEEIVKFIAAVHAMQTNPEKTITWNIEEYASHMTAKCGEDYSVLSIPIWKKLFGRIVDIEEAKGKADTFPFIIHLSNEEVNKEVLFVKDSLNNISSCIRDKVANPEYIVLGFGSLERSLPDTKDLSQKMVQQELQQRMEKWQHSRDLTIFPFASLTNLYAAGLAYWILIDGVMEKLGIQSVKVMDANPDPITGLLLEPKFWKRS